MNRTTHKIRRRLVSILIIPVAIRNQIPTEGKPVTVNLSEWGGSIRTIITARESVVDADILSVR
jgi:hypothetical protein